MKWYFKVIIFLIILAILIEGVSILFMPNLSNLGQFGLFKKTQYDILDEENDTIDTIFLGDSLVYSSIIPMDIWNDYGFTSFNCSIPVQTIDNTYKYLEVAIDSQHPKVVMMEADILFRDSRSRAKYKNELTKLKNLIPLLKFHNNWKQIGKGKVLNIYKGYKVNLTVKPSKIKHRVITPSVRKVDFKEYNLEYFDKMVELCNKNNIKLILLSNPTLSNWSMEKHNSFEELAKEKNIDFLDLNYKDLDIDWELESKDAGRHLNYYGAKKVSAYLGEYMKSLNILEDHREDKKYDDWHKAYKIYKLNTYE